MIGERLHVSALTETAPETVLIVGNGVSRKKRQVLPSDFLSIGFNEIIDEPLVPDIVVIDRHSLLVSALSRFHLLPNPPKIAVPRHLHRVGLYEYDEDQRPSWTTGVFREDHAVHAAVGIAALLGAKTVVLAGVDLDPDGIYAESRQATRNTQNDNLQSRRKLEFDINRAKISIRTLYSHGDWSYPLVRSANA